jgi:hypothetical protein
VVLTSKGLPLGALLLYFFTSTKSDSNATSIRLRRGLLLHLKDREGLKYREIAKLPEFAGVPQFQPFGCVWLIIRFAV